MAEQDYGGPSQVLIDHWNDEKYRNWAKIYSADEYRLMQAHVAWQTEQTMHSAWRKRAEEAESALAGITDPAAFVREVRECLQALSDQTSDERISPSFGYSRSTKGHVIVTARRLLALLPAESVR